MTQYIPSTKAVSTPLTLMMTRSGMRICLFSLTPPFFQILSLAGWDFFLHPQVSFGKNPGAWERRSQAKSSFADNFFIFAAKLRQNPSSRTIFQFSRPKITLRRTNFSLLKYRLPATSGVFPHLPQVRLPVKGNSVQLVTFIKRRAAVWQ